MRLIRVMCSGRVDMGFVLKAFSKGIDGVFIGACHLDECNYMTHGNYQAQNMVLLFKKIMERMGLNPERLRLAFMSGSEANVYVDSVNEFVKNVKELGPIGEGEGIDADELKGRIEEVKKLIPYIKMAKREKLEARLETREECEGYFTAEEIDKLFSEVVSYYIDPAKCQACMICAKRCPVEAIDGGKNRIHVIDQDKCIKCGTCFEACPPRFGSIRKIVGEPVPPPVPEDQRTVERKGKEKAAA